MSCKSTYSVHRLVGLNVALLLNYERQKGKGGIAFPGVQSEGLDPATAAYRHIVGTSGVGDRLTEVDGKGESSSVPGTNPNT